MRAIDLFETSVVVLKEVQLACVYSMWSRAGYDKFSSKHLLQMDDFGGVDVFRVVGDSTLHLT